MTGPLDESAPLEDSYSSADLDCDGPDPQWECRIEAKEADLAAARAERHAERDTPKDTP